jgi:hypothetical protein
MKTSEQLQQEIDQLTIDIERTNVYRDSLIQLRNRIDDGQTPCTSSPVLPLEVRLEQEMLSYQFTLNTLDTACKSNY